MSDMNDESELRRINAELKKRVAELEGAITEHRLTQEQYQIFFTENIFSVYWIEFKNPIPIDLPVEEQVDMIFREGYIKDISDICAKIYGLSRKQLIGQYVTALWEPGFEDRNSMRHQYYQQFVKAGYVAHPTEASQMTTKEGKQKWFLSRMKGVIENGHLVRYWSSHIDITERKKSEGALLESEEKYRTLFEIAQDGIFVLDAETGKTVLANIALAKLFGFESTEDIIGLSPFEFIPEEDRARMKRIIVEDMFEKDLREVMEYRAITKDNREIWVSAVGVRIVYKGKMAGLVSVRDITGRKRTEEALQESEEKFREMAELLPEVIYECDAQGNLTFVNKVAFEKYGLTRGDFDKGVNVLQFIAPEDRKSMRENLKIVLSDVGRGPFEYTALRKDGSKYPIITYSSPIIRDGNPVGFRGIAIDITERKAAEEELKETTKLLQSVIDNTTNEAIITTDQMGIILIWNEGARRLLGYESEEVVGRKSIQIFHTEEYLKSGIMDMNIKKMLATGNPLTEELNFVTKDGKTIYVQEIVSPCFDEDSKFIGMVGMARDITEQEKVNKELIRQKLQYQGIFEASKDTLLILDLKGVIREVNPTACKMYGYSYEEMIGLSGKDIVHSDYQYLFKKIMKDTFAGKTFHTESVDIRKDGSTFNIDVRVSAFEYEGKPHILAVIRDITERKKAEEEQEKLRMQLTHAQKMESVGQLAGGVAHDFNNMLGVILGYTDIAMEQIDRNQPLYSYFVAIRKAAERSTALTQQLLAFARKQTINPRILDLNVTVKGMLKMLRQIIGEDIDLALLPGVGMWSVKIDPSQIDQILANLCVNARDAIDDVGKITIETDEVAFDEDYCIAHHGFYPGEYVLLSVSDNGCGMDKEILDKVFEPFFTTKEIGKGTGLGLSTVYGIVKQNGGFINVYSEPGHGTTFKIYLPRHSVRIPEIQKESQVKSPQKGYETILLVEDELVLLEMTRTMLEILGYAVLSASTPGEAIRLIESRTGKIHLLLTDVVMPEMNGRDLVRKLLPLYPNLKYLFMSGYTSNVITHHGVMDEGVKFLQKPFSVEKLADKVREVLDGK